MISKTRFQARDSLDPPGSRFAVPTARRIAQVTKPLGGSTRTPTQRAKGCLQFTYRLALTLMASPRPRNVKSKEEPP